MMTHNERCKECKKRMFELLSKSYGEVKQDYNLHLSNKLDSFKDNLQYTNLQKIFTSLKNHRGFQNFVKAKNLPNVDFFIVNPGFIVEFDESQHFTKPREIALKNYPTDLKLGFDKQKWIKHCENLHKKDNDPPYRDEQRAWYDTMRDFAPFILNFMPTIRLFAKDHVWCSFDPENSEDIKKFKTIIEGKV